ncbi:energy-coupling factor transporter transmembrane protein EcfT [Desulfococcus sp.]|uniref:energy-coupling factor transporter transmembrane component T family protein n=1 Tax=Desulfococcus sp. TaxID=2025834 RepID=UPI003593AD35
MLDPRTKLITTLLAAAFVGISDPLFLVAAELGLLLAMIAALGFFRAYVRWLALVVPMALFFGGVTAWSVTADAGILAGAKLLTLTTAAFIFFSATVPEDLGNALVKAGLPYPAAFVMSTALQFVPVIGRKARDVLDAQRSRGIPVEPGWSALKHYPAFFIPLLLQSFQLAEELAEAMEARGFGRPGRSFLAAYRLTLVDWAVLAASGASLGALAMIQYSLLPFFWPAGASFGKIVLMIFPWGS